MVYPIPAVLISCGDEPSEYNLMTAAWTGTVCSEPPMCYVSVRKERHSYDIIRRTGEFVINLTTEALAEATDWCGVRSGKDFDKFAYCGLTPEKSKVVKAPAVAESPVAIECRVRQCLELGSHDMFLADVVVVRVDERLVDAASGKLDLAGAGLMCYVHGGYYGLGNMLGTFGWSVKGSTKKAELARMGKMKKISK